MVTVFFDILKAYPSGGQGLLITAAVITAAMVVWGIIDSTPPKAKKNT